MKDKAQDKNGSEDKRAKEHFEGIYTFYKYF